STKATQRDPTRGGVHTGAGSRTEVRPHAHGEPHRHRHHQRGIHAAHRCAEPATALCFRARPQIAGPHGSVDGNDAGRRRSGETPRSPESPRLACARKPAGMTLDLTQFHGVFFEESFEALDSMEAALLKLDVGAPDRDRINTIFRVAHSIKGGSATFGFKDIASFTPTLAPIPHHIPA